MPRDGGSTLAALDLGRAVTVPEGIVAFGVGSGRCGTTLLSKLAELEPEVAASHERLRRAATFHMFCKWHGVPIDPEGFLGDRDTVVREDLAEHRVSFEVSALLSHSIAELHERYDARFVMLVRRPDHTVASFAARGWFLDPIPWADATRPPTLPDAMEPGSGNLEEVILLLTHAYEVETPENGLRRVETGRHLAIVLHGHRLFNQQLNTTTIVTVFDFI